MKDKIVLDKIDDMQEVFDVCGYALEQQEYTVTREGMTLKASAGNILLRKTIEVVWSEQNIIIEYKGSKFVIRLDIEFLVSTINSLHEALESGLFTEENRMFNFSSKHF